MWKGLDRERELNKGICGNTPEGQIEKFGSDKICDREPVQVLEFLSIEMVYEMSEED